MKYRVVKDVTNPDDPSAIIVQNNDGKDMVFLSGPLSMYSAGIVIATLEGVSLPYNPVVFARGYMLNR